MPLDHQSINDRRERPGGEGSAGWTLTGCIAKTLAKPGAEPVYFVLLNRDEF
jgi:hypothetical protein